MVNKKATPANSWGTSESIWEKTVSMRGRRESRKVKKVSMMVMTGRISDCSGCILVRPGCMMGKLVSTSDWMVSMMGTPGCS